MKYKIENVNFYVIKELLECHCDNVKSIERRNPETAVVVFNKKMNKADIEDILKNHPVKDVSQDVKISLC